MEEMYRSVECIAGSELARPSGYDGVHPADFPGTAGAT